MNIKISDIIENKDNPNLMTEKNLEKLKRLIEEEKNYPPLIVNKRKDGKYFLIDGHQRLKVLKELGYKEVKCDVWEVDKDTEYILIATLNRLHGKTISERRKELYKVLEKRISYDKLASIIPDTRRRLDEILDKANRIKLDIEVKKIQFFQLLTKEEYDYVMDYVKKHIKKEDRDRAIYLIIRSINGDK